MATTPPIPLIKTLLCQIFLWALTVSQAMYHFTPVGKVQVPKTTYGTVQQPRHISRKMNELFTGFKNVRAYIDDLLVLTKCLFSNHLAAIDSVLKN